jgi:hypothetical protein
MIPRRMLGFGFALFLILVILAAIYSQYVMRGQSNPADDMVRSKPAMGTEKPAAPSTATAPLPTAVNPDTAADDLIDEALADRDDLSTFAEDELADIEEGN